MAGVLKGIAWFSTVALASVGALTFVPDGAWDSFPQPFSSVRTRLADIGVAPIKFSSQAQSPQPVRSELDEPYVQEYARSRALEHDSAPAFTPANGASRVRIGGLQRAASAIPAQETRNVPEPDPSYGDFPEVTPPVAESRFSGVSTENRSEPAVDKTPVAQQVENQNSGLLAAVSDDSFFGTSLAEPDLPAAAAYGDDALRSAPANPAFADPAPEPTPSKEPGSLAQDVGAADVAADFARAAAADHSAMPQTPELPDAMPEDPLARNPFAEDVRAESNAAPAPEAQPIAETATYQTSEQPGSADLPPVEDALENNSAPLTATVETPVCDPTAAPVANASAAMTPDAQLDAVLLSAQRIETAEQARDVFITLNKLRREFVASGAAAQVNRANEALDRLAYEVFYNPQRAILEPMRQTKPGETFVSLAREYDVTPETLAAINGYDAPVDSPLPPGTVLKVVRGPVTAELSESKRELLLNFNHLYAGRFKFGTPQQAQNLRGEYVVENKIENPVCDAVDTTGAKITIPGGSQENPLGSCWIGLTGGIGLQGTNRPELIGMTIPENGGFVFSNREISQLSVLLPVGASVYFLD